MKLYDKDNFEWSVYKTKKPKFSMHRGRTWDSIEGSIDKIKITIHLDTTWSRYCYFEYMNNWYKISNEIWEEIRKFTTIKRLKENNI